MARTVQYLENYYVLLDNVLYHLYNPRTKGVPPEEKVIRQLWLPEALRREALEAYHDSEAGGGHLGVNRTHGALQRKYFWQGMYQDVHDYIASCDVCQKVKRPVHKRHAPYQSLPVEDVFHRWHIDFMSLTKTPEGYQHVLVIVDSFSKWVEAFPTKTQEATEVARILYDEVFTRFGAPKTIVSDRGRNFMSKLVNALCELFHVKRIVTSSYHPQSNSAVERYNAVIAQSLRAYSNAEQTNWPKLLPSMLMALRMSPCTESTKESPYRLVFGSEMNVPFDTGVIPKETLGKDAKQHLAQLLENLKVVREVAKQNVIESQQKSMDRNNARAQEPQFRIMDEVLVKSSRTPTGLSPKLHPKWEGPFYIVKVNGNNTFKLRRCSDDKLVQAPIHADRLKSYKNPTERRQVQPTDQPNNRNTDDQHNEDDSNDANQNNNTSGDDDKDGSEDGDKDDDDDATCLSDNASQDSNSQRLPDSKNTNDKWYAIKAILKSRLLPGSGTREYYIKWEGNYPNSWEPSYNVGAGVRREFHAKKTLSGKARKRTSSHFYKIK